MDNTMTSKEKNFLQSVGIGAKRIGNAYVTSFEARPVETMLASGATIYAVGYFIRSLKKSNKN